jgi:hypothetical protein
MVTRLAVDTELMQEAIESDSQATIETVVETAFREYIRRTTGAYRSTTTSSSTVLLKKW